VEKARQRHKQIEKRRRSKANLCATKVGKTLSAVIKEKNEEEVVSGRMTKSSSATKLATANEQQANFKIANSSSASKLTGVTNQVFKPGTSHLPETLNPDQQLANAATVTTRLNTLEMQNATLQHQIMALGQQLSAIQQQVGPLKAISALSTTSGPEKNTGSFGFKSMVIKLQQKLGTLGFIVAVLFGFMFIIFFLRGILVRGDGNRSRVVEPTPSAHHPTEDYDFMASQESIPSKLNLAHAYLDMGNTKGASDILNEVMVSGDAAQQAEAKALLDKIVK
jgi:FimV-like protein